SRWSRCQVALAARQVSRVANHRVRTCCAYYPGEQGDRPLSVHLGRPRRPSSFERGLGAHIIAFRGLLRLHSRCGPHACEPAQGGSLSPGLRWVGRPRHLLGSYQGVPTLPWAGLSPAALTYLSRRTLELPILALNRAFGNVARRQTPALR